MTKKDFILIAQVIASLPDASRYDTAKAFADRLAMVNPLFKRDVFLKACNVKG